MKRRKIGFSTMEEAQLREALMAHGSMLMISLEFMILWFLGLAIMYSRLS